MAKSRKRAGAVAERELLTWERPQPAVDVGRLLGLSRVDRSAALRARVRKGLPYSALERLQVALALDLEQLARLIQVSARTLERRRNEGRLHALESDRVVRVARIFILTLELFEADAVGARRWLRKANPALGGETPLAMADTEIGAREVEELTGRLEHGVFT